MTAPVSSSAREGAGYAALHVHTQLLSRLARRLARADQDAEDLVQETLARVAGTNHMMPLQDPEAVARLIHDFAGRHS